MKLPVMNEALAERIRQAEVDFFTSRIRSIGERTGNPEGVEIRTFGSATAFYIKTMPWPLFNSVKGFSSEDLDQTGEIIRFYQERERAFRLDVNPDTATAELCRHLARNGLFQESFHSVFYGLPSKERPSLPANISIRQIEHEADFDIYAGIHCVGSGMDIAHKRC